MTLPFSKDFQRKLLTLLLDNYQYILTEDLVDPSYFEDPIDARLCEVTIVLYRELKTAPTRAVIWEELKHAQDASELKLFKKRFRTLAGIEPTEADKQYIVTELRSFAGIQAIKNAIQDSIEPLREGDLEKVRELLHASLTVGDEDPLPETYYFEDVASRVAASERNGRAVRTLIHDLDQVLRNHGLGRREIGIVLAISSVGKTMFLCHLSKAAVLQRLKVLYLALDDPLDLITERLDGSFTGINLSELSESRSDVITKISELGKVYSESLLIKEAMPGTTIDEIEGYIDKVIGSGFSPDLIMVDYLNLIGGDASLGRWKEVGEIVNDLKRLSKKYNIALWTAAQANRSALGKELTTMAEIAESFEAIMGANIVISLNRTPEEKKRQAMRLFLNTCVRQRSVAKRL
jgi:replicative DNA helicase